MGTGGDTGVNNIARKIISGNIGVNNIARKIIGGWVGDANGIARKFYAPSGGGVITPSSLILLKSKAETHSGSGNYGYTVTNILVSTDHGDTFTPVNTVYNGRYAGDFPYNALYDDISQKVYLCGEGIEKVPDTDGYVVERYGDDSVINLGIANGKLWSVVIRPQESVGSAGVYIKCVDLSTSDEPQPTAYYNYSPSGTLKKQWVFVPRTHRMVAHNPDTAYGGGFYMMNFNYTCGNQVNVSTINNIMSWMYHGGLYIENDQIKNVLQTYYPSGSSATVYGSKLGTPQDIDADVFVDYMSVYGHNKGYMYGKKVANERSFLDAIWNASQNVFYTWNNVNATRDTDNMIYYNGYLYVPTVTSNQIAWKRAAVGTINFTSVGTTPIPENISGDVYTNIISDGSYFYVIARTRSNFLRGMSGGVNGCPAATDNTPHKIYRIDPSNITATPTLIYTGGDEFLTIAYANDKGTYYVPNEY